MGLLASCCEVFNSASDSPHTLGPPELGSDNPSVGGGIGYFYMNGSELLSQGMRGVFSQHCQLIIFISYSNFVHSFKTIA